LPSKALSLSKGRRFRPENAELQLGPPIHFTAKTTKTGHAHPRAAPQPMKDQLKAVADSYDRAIVLGKQGIDQYKEFPELITATPAYRLFLKMREEGNLSDSARDGIRTFLSPGLDMRFIDFGCCLNLMFRGYNKWASLYHGVDISPNTIELLQSYANRNRLRTGALVCCGMHETPFADAYFEIGACIGSLEYFEKAYVQSAMKEFRRLIKPAGRLVLDIPDVGSPEFKSIAMIEEHLGRRERFNMTIAEFEAELRPFWSIAHREKVGPMLQYFLSSRK